MKKNNNTIHIDKYFKGYEKRIKFLSDEHLRLAYRKTLLSFGGYKSHPVLFNVMTNDNKFYCVPIDDNESIYLLNKQEIDNL